MSQGMSKNNLWITHEVWVPYVITCLLWLASLRFKLSTSILRIVA